VKYFACLMPLALAACSTMSQPPQTPSSQFYTNIKALCGQSFKGTLTAGDESDAAFRSAPMFAHVNDCSDSEIRIAFDVGEDRSRTWIISKVGDGLRLKHRHMLKSGNEDPVSQYGGDTVAFGSANRQEFPADSFSKKMFAKEGRTVSITNIWAFEISPKQTLTYELSRPSRLFRVSFDLKQPLSK
jgi:hypothetical protein